MERYEMEKMLDNFTRYLSYMLQINSAKTIEELKHLKMLCTNNYTRWWKSTYSKEFIDFKINQLNSKENQKNENVFEMKDLIDGEYYYLYLTDNEQLTVPIKKDESNTNAEVYDNIPVVALYSGKELVDIISGKPFRFTLNPLDALSKGSHILVDHVVRLNRENLYKEANTIRELRYEGRTLFQKKLTNILIDKH